MANEVRYNTTVPCSVRSSLNPLYSDYRQMFRTIAEERSTIRFDAINLATFQVLQHLADPDQHSLPPLMTKAYWSQAYRIVTQSLVQPPYYNTEISPELQADFNVFDRFRRDDDTGDYLYDVPVFNGFHGHLANKFEREIVTNIKVHLTNNIRKYLKRVVDKFLSHHRKEVNGADFSPKDEAKKWVAAIVERGTLHRDTFREMSPNGYAALRDFFEERDKEFRTFFRGESIDVVGDSTYAVKNYGPCLQYSNALLTYAKQNPLLQIKLWSILPVATNAVTFFNISEAVGLHQLLGLALSKGYPVPLIAMDRNEELIGYKAFIRAYRDDMNFKNQIWRVIFQVDQVLRKKLRRGSRYSLGYGAQTDGHTISFLLEKRSRRLHNVIPNSLRELSFIPRRVDVGGWNNGMIELRREPIGLRQTDFVVGVDPGARDLVTIANQGTTKENREQNTWSMSNAHYQERSGIKWHRTIELKSRMKANMQPVYDTMLSPKTNVVDEFIAYIISMAQTRRRVLSFNSSYRHREIRANLRSNRQAAQASIADTIVGVNPILRETQMPFKLYHNKNPREEKRRRREKRASVGHERRTRRTVVAYGDANVNSSMKNFAPLPQKSLQRMIAQKGLVVRTDEYKTSQICSTCQEPLLELLERRLAEDCTHRKKKIYVKEGAKRRKPNRFCQDEAFTELMKADDCPQKVPQGYHKQIWALKLCAVCSRDLPDPKKHQIWNRDVNAAINICNIDIQYIFSGCDIESRPVNLKRGRQE